MTRLRRHPLVRYGLAPLTVAAAIATFYVPGGGIGAAASVLYFAVFLNAWFGGLGPGLFTTALTVVASLYLATRGGRMPDPAVFVALGLFTAGGVLVTLAVRSMDRARRRAEANAQEAARQSERLATTLRSIGDAVIVADERGRVVSLNPAAEALTGWDQDDASGRPLMEVFRVEGDGTVSSARDSAERLLNDWGIGGLSGRSAIVARDGTRRPVDETAATIRSAGGKILGAVLVFRDVTERRDAERRIAEAEARFRAFMDHSPVVAFIKDGQGRYAWGNPAWGRLHAGGLESALGKTDFELWPEATARKFREGDLAALDSGGASEVDEPSVGRDGTHHHWISLKFPIGDPGQPLLGGISVDATERIGHERALRDSEERYRNLFDANPLPMWVYDTESLRFLAVNEAAVRNYGYAREEFLAMRIVDIRPPEDVPALMARIAQVRAAERGDETAWRHRRKDGSLIDVEITSHAFAFEGRAARLVLAHDVTARRRAEEALGINRERLDLVLGAAELGVWYGDIPASTFTLNDRARDHHGIAVEEAATFEAMAARVHPDDIQSVRDAAGRAIDEGDSYDATYRVPIGESSLRWIRAIGRAFADASGRVARFDGITIDVTRQKEAEAQLREATEAAVEANRAKDRFLAVLGHELRTPLTPVLAAVSTLLEHPARDGVGGPAWSEEQVRETLAMIRRNVELETRLINDVLDVARVQRGQLRLQLETVDLHRIIREAVDICRDEILVSGLDVRLALTAPEHTVEADPARVLQIAWNLIHNAAKFSPPGARLTIRTANAPPLGDADFPSIVAEFEDSGVGMERDVLARVFEPFEQGDIPARRRIGGLGLGLAIGRSLADAHGGRLTAESPGLGLGSTFRLELTTIPRPLPSDRPAPRLDDDAPASARNVLLVEDNRDTLRYLSALLGHRGYRVTTASGVVEAEAAASSGSPFDLMISDIELPDGSGLDLMRSLRGKLVGVAVSGFGSDSDVQLSLEAGFSAHLTKPLDFARLEAAIRDALSVGSP